MKSPQARGQHTKGVQQLSRFKPDLSVRFATVGKAAREYRAIPTAECDISTGSHQGHLQEFYGGVEWSVRGIYADRLGWFDGNATNLFPLPPKDRAAKLVGLLGGPDQVLARGREALAARDFKWTAELADYVLANDSANAVAKRLKAQALIELGERQINAIARNWPGSSVDSEFALHLSRHTWRTMRRKAHGVRRVGPMVRTPVKIVRRGFIDRQART